VHVKPWTVSHVASLAQGPERAVPVLLEPPLAEVAPVPPHSALVHGSLPQAADAAAAAKTMKAPSAPNLFWARDAGERRIGHRELP